MIGWSTKRNGVFKRWNEIICSRNKNAGNGVDMINQFDLECPYGLAACVSSASASVVSQVELV